MDPVKIHCGLGTDKPIERLNYLRGWAEAQGYVCIDHALVSALYDELVHVTHRWKVCLDAVERLEKKHKKGTP
jgi:hypothetical protein